MKNYKALIFIVLLTTLIACGDKNNSKNLFSIDESTFKSMFHNSDTIRLTLKNDATESIVLLASFFKDK